MHVEDDDTCAYALSFALREQNADVDVFRLCDGEDAVLFLTRAGIFANAPRPDVVVLDLNLPKKNGHEVVVEVRKQADLQHVPVIMLSSSLRPQDRERALSLGANGYIHKPADLHGFTAVAIRVLQFISNG